ncbi:MAG: BtpA/SgcQ family protein [Planctomycetota bacterium]
MKSKLEKPLLGVVHLRALPSASRHVSMDEVFAWAERDAAALAAGGVDGLVVENFGDAPFHKGTVSDPVAPDVPAALAVVARELRLRHDLPVMVNCLRNDGIAALGAAAVAGAKWVRVNVLASAYVTDQGVIEGEAARLCAYRKQLASKTKILADFLVKHATPLAPFDLGAAARDLAERSGADGLVLSGSRTGEPVDEARLDAVRAAVRDFPVWLGSGLDTDNAAALWPRCDGAIVGTSLKRGGRVDAPVDRARVSALVAAVRSASRSRRR